jgi:hypothetical protein
MSATETETASAAAAIEATETKLESPGTASAAANTDTKSEHVQTTPATANTTEKKVAEGAPTAATTGDTEIQSEEPTFEIPKTCKAAVVRNEGPDFYVVSSSQSP